MLKFLPHSDYFEVHNSIKETMEELLLQKYVHLLHELKERLCQH